MSFKNTMIIIAVILVSLHLLGWLGIFEGKREGELGILNNRLYPCINTDACVVSRPPENNPQYVHSILAKSQWDQAREEIQKYLEENRCKTIQATPVEYLYFECRTFFLRTMDDLELYYANNEGRIHVRSRARIKWLDWGRQRRRLDNLRKQIGRPDDPHVGYGKK